MIILVIVLAIVLILAVWVIGSYNSLVQLRNKAKDQWAQVDVQLKKRFDLIPNLVETVKGYAKHEKETLEEVIAARNKFATASTPEEEMKSAGEVTKALNKIMALSEAYPELKANENFLELQKELKECEEKVAYARQFYNDTVLSYTNKREMFPSNIIAGMFKFEAMKYFEIAESEKEAPKVSF